MPSEPADKMSAPHFQTGSERLTAAPPFTSRLVLAFHPHAPPRYAAAMSWFYRACVRPALFAQDSEAIHDRTLAVLGHCSRQATLCEALAAFYAAPALPVSV